MLRFHRFASRTPFLFAADKGGPSGGGSPLSIEDRLAAAQSELDTSRQTVASLTAERDTARTELSASQAEVIRLTAQFDSLTATANDAQGQVTSLTGQLTTATAERDQARTSLVTANTNVSRLETLCRLKGVDPASAVPPLGQPAPAEHTRTELLSKLDKTTDPAERGRLAQELRKLKV